MLFPILLRKRNLFHFLYAENHYSGLLFNIIKGNSKIICTYHQPPSFFEKEISERKKNCRRYSKIDLVIVLANSLISTMRTLSGKNNVVFIPHGVDTDYFTPNIPFSKEDCEIVSVGNWMRDFELLKGICAEIHKVRKDILFRVISLRENTHYFANSPNVLFEYDLSDNELLERYRRAKLLLLPLKDTIANNALLEGMSCGLPSVISNVGAVSDYTNSKCSILVDENRPASFVKEILSIIDREFVLQEMGFQSRRKCINEFSWPIIGKKLIFHYDLLSK